MSNGDLRQIEPLQLHFPFESKKQASCPLQLTNNSNNHVAFKVKTTNPKNYCVRPNTGVCMPHSSCDVMITMQAQKEAPSDMQCKDKFLVQSVVVNAGVTMEDITPEMFNKKSENQVDECKLGVSYVPPPQPRSTVIELVRPPIRLAMSNGERLQIEPLELCFPFELKKQISCPLQLTNNSNNHIAFKVKTTNLKKYSVRPNTGVVMPHSSCDVNVTMQAQKEAPPDMQCRDKFLVQSIVVNSGVTRKDITPEMFNKESGNQVDECKLIVSYVLPPQPPPPVMKLELEFCSKLLCALKEPLVGIFSSCGASNVNVYHKIKND